VLLIRSAAFAQHTKSIPATTKQAGWRVLAALARVRVFLEFRPARVWSNSKRRKRSRKQFPRASATADSVGFDIRTPRAETTARRQ
jgi:hypothetical protein